MVSEHASPLTRIGAVDAGGQNVYVAALARACARQGHRVVVYTRRDATRLRRCVRLAPGVDVVHIPGGPATAIPKDEIYPHVPEMAANLLGEWSADPPDVVHAHFWMSGLAALLAANPLGLPVVTTFHALGRTKRQWQGSRDTSPDARLAEEQYLARASDRIVATARHEMFELRAMGAARRRISLVPCGVDLAQFHVDVDGANAEPRRERFRLLCVSRLVERKGLGTVVEALADIPNAELVIAGGPERRFLHHDPEARRLLRLAARCGVAHRVRMLGQVGQAELPALYASADLAICTPWYEPFGMVAVEAMACGLPVIAANVGGLRDTVIDGQTGVQIPPREPATLARVANELLENEPRRREIGRHAAERTRRRYGWDTVASSMLDAYRITRTRSARVRRAAG